MFCAAPAVAAARLVSANVVEGPGETVTVCDPVIALEGARSRSPSAIARLERHREGVDPLVRRRELVRRRQHGLSVRRGENDRAAIAGRSSCR